MLGDDELGEVAERLVNTWRQVLLTFKRCTWRAFDVKFNITIIIMEADVIAYYCRVLVYIAYVIGGESAEVYIASAR